MPSGGRQNDRVHPRCMGHRTLLGSVRGYFTERGFRCLAPSWPHKARRPSSAAFTRSKRRLKPAGSSSRPRSPSSTASVRRRSISRADASAASHHRRFGRSQRAAGNGQSELTEVPPTRRHGPISMSSPDEPTGSLPRRAGRRSPHSYRTGWRCGWLPVPIQIDGALAARDLSHVRRVCRSRYERHSNSPRVSPMSTTVKELRRERADQAHEQKAADDYRSASGTQRFPEGPVYSDSGRMSRLSPCCSMMCAHQPAMRPMANNEVPRSAGSPRYVYVVAA